MDEAGGLVEFDVPEFSSGVLSQLNELRLQGKLCDIVVHIQGRPFRAHKAVLAASSPYFRDHSALGTMSGLSISVIKSPEVFERLLAFCYTGRMSLRLRDVVSFLTAASFLQMQDVIDRCTRILEGLHSKISLPPGGGPGKAGAAHGAGHNGVGEGGEREEEEDEEEEGDVLGDPSPAHFSPAPTRFPREEVAGRGRGRRPAEEERRSERGSSDGEAELEQVELIGRDGQVTDVRVKLEREGGDVDGGGDGGGYPMETADGEQVLAVSVGSSVLRPVVYPYPPPAPAHSPAGHARHGRPSPSRSLLGGYYGNRGRPKRASVLAAAAGAGEGMGVAQKEGLENDVRVRSLRAQWGSPGDPYGPHGDRLVCVYCGKSFNQKGSLDRHMRLHMGITPFACVYCGKRYTRKDQLEYHIRGHTDNKPFSCHLCGKSFPFQGTLNQHLRKKHLTAAPSDSPEAPVHEPDDAPPPKPRPHLPYEPPPPTGSNNGKESPNASP